MLICCGLTTLDITQVVHALPGPDEKVVATSQRATFGGPAANAAATAAALGVPVRLVTAVGTGMLAEVVRADVVAAGVELIDVTADGHASPSPGDETRGPAVSTVLVTAGTGERAVVSTNATDRPVAAGDARAVSRVLEPVRQGGARGQERDVLLLDGHHPCLAHALAARARELGVLVVLDGGSWKDGTAELVALCDAVVLSADFRMPGRDVGRVLEDVAALGPGFVARSRGGAPVEVLDGGVRSDLPVPVADGVVDTLGAGDVLHGAFAAEVARGLSWGRALREAVAVASRSVAYEGARGWIGR
ncbi:PfkB family carbohydrate kinase [Oerskovia sp. NPDC057915]|uniref:PfkB family carbohydrate kinase n=1 Tax=Oerskovia sp. NPDC057915 TaxID=3346280 RepID=UPI0036D942B7